MGTYGIDINKCLNKENLNDIVNNASNRTMKVFDPPPIEYGIELKNYVDPLDQYYEEYYTVNNNGILFNDISLMFHSNKLCVLTLADSHPIRASSLVVHSVDFNISEKCNRLENKISGKKKRGAQIIGKTSPICVIRTSTFDYTVITNIPAKLIEINENLCTNTDLLKDKINNKGYIAILSPMYNREYDIKQDLMTRSKYLQFIETRGPYLP